MRRVSALLLAGGLILGTPGLAFADHHDDGYGNGNEYDQRYGNEGDQSRCRGRDCRGSFSPGPFKDSPITIWFCPQPNSCNSRDGSGPPEGAEG